MPALWCLPVGSTTTPGWCFLARFPFPLPPGTWLPLSQERLPGPESRPALREFLQVDSGLGRASPSGGPGRTCAGHVHGIQVCSVVAVAADAVGGPF